MTEKKTCSAHIFFGACSSFISAIQVLNSKGSSHRNSLVSPFRFCVGKWRACKWTDPPSMISEAIPAVPWIMEWTWTYVLLKKPGICNKPRFASHSRLTEGKPLTDARPWDPEPRPKKLCNSAVVTCGRAAWNLECGATYCAACRDFNIS